MSKDLSGRYYQKKKKKSPMKDIKILLQKKKTKSENMVANDVRISQKLKNNCYLSIEKGITKCETIKI